MTVAWRAISDTPMTGPVEGVGVAMEAGAAGIVGGAYAAAAFLKNKRIDALPTAAVSYTHLTLPTICSV